jgi:hypothetical protein
MPDDPLSRRLRLLGDDQRTPTVSGGNGFPPRPGPPSAPYAGIVLPDGTPASPQAVEVNMQATAAQIIRTLKMLPSFKAEVDRLEKWAEGESITLDAGQRAVLAMCRLMDNIQRKASRFFDTEKARQEKAKKGGDGE